MNRAAEKKVRKRGAAIVFCLLRLSSQPAAAPPPPPLSTLPVSSLCVRAWGYLGSPVTLCPLFDAELPLGGLIPFLRK